MLPSRLRWYVEAPLRGGLGDATRVSAHPLWSPSIRFGSRFLTPYLEREADSLYSAVESPALVSLTVVSPAKTRMSSR